MYRAFATNVISAISIYDASDAITMNAAYSPADALLRKLVMNPSNGVKPTLRATIPNVNDTTKYPSPIGIPSRNPSLNACRFVRSIASFPFNLTFFIGSIIIRGKFQRHEGIDSMKISAKGRYALLSMTYLAQNFDSNSPITIITISSKMGISKIYLEQVFAILKRANLVDSIKGSQGGYRLSRAPKKITVYDILSMIELALMEESISESLMPELDRAINSCIYQPLDEKIFDFLKTVTLDDILTAVAHETDAASQMYFI